jgi:hypothetical protein
MDKMGEVDRAALQMFLEGSTPEARKALGHLLRNAVQPLALLYFEDCRKLVELINVITPDPATGSCAKQE